MQGDVTKNKDMTSLKYHWSQNTEMHNRIKELPNNKRKKVVARNE